MILVDGIIPSATEDDRKSDLFHFLKINHISFKEFPYDWLVETDFFRAPASSKFHAAYPGGLYDHCCNVTLKLMDFDDKGVTERWERYSSPVIIGMLHDVTKIYLYKVDHYVISKKGISATYVKNPDYDFYGGHGYDSVRKLEKVMKLTEEEKACIRYHMGAYETKDWDEFDKAIRKYPNVLWTHTADMFASKLMEEE